MEGKFQSGVFASSGITPQVLSTSEPSGTAPMNDQVTHLLFH